MPNYVPININFFNQIRYRVTMSEDFKISSKKHQGEFSLLETIIPVLNLSY